MDLENRAELKAQTTELQTAEAPSAQLVVTLPPQYIVCALGLMLGWGRNPELNNAVVNGTFVSNANTFVSSFPAQY